MSKSKIPLLLLALSALTCASAFARQGGDGGVFNGPSMNPVSIPIATDRGLPIEQIDRVVNFCGVTGDADRGVRSLAVRFLQDIHGGSLQDWKRKLSTINPPVTDFRDEKKLRLNVEAQISSSDHFGSVTFSAVQKKGTNAEFETTTISFYEEKGGSKRSVYLRTETPDTFMPYLTYQSLEIVYVELGEEKEKRYTGLTLHVPGQANQAIPLFNSDRPTSASLKLSEYVDCLRASLGG